MAYLVNSNCLNTHALLTTVANTIESLKVQFWSGSNSSNALEIPFVLLDHNEPSYLFGAADGYLKNGKISSNIQFPIAPAKELDEIQCFDPIKINGINSI